MRITIDLEPTSTIASVTGPVSVPAETIIQATPEYATQGAALNAGACLAVGSGEETSALPPQNTSAGIPGGASEGALSAGAAKG